MYVIMQLCIYIIASPKWVSVIQISKHYDFCESPSENLQKDVESITPKMKCSNKQFYTGDPGK